MSEKPEWMKNQGCRACYCYVKYQVNHPHVAHMVQPSLWKTWSSIKNVSKSPQFLFLQKNINYFTLEWDWKFTIFLNFDLLLHVICCFLLNFVIFSQTFHVFVGAVLRVFGRNSSVRRFPWYVWKYWNSVRPQKITQNLRKTNFEKKK